jgi:hypothetical protein
MGPVREPYCRCPEEKVVREIMVFLHSHGVGALRAMRVHHGIGAGQVVSALLEARQDLPRCAFGLRLADGTVMAGRVGEIDCVTSEDGGTLALASKVLDITGAPGGGEDPHCQFDSAHPGSKGCDGWQNLQGKGEGRHVPSVE